METAFISKIQHYSTKDGPGLRTTVFFMGCNLRCLWCANPENLVARKRVFYFRARCQKCGTCVQYAANRSITLNETGCTIDREKCTNLMDMAELCPFDAYEIIGQELTVDEVYDKVMRDKEFFQMGEGGVTFSGGEAALQPDFICELSDRLRAEGIHVCLDTAGLIPTEQMKRLLSHVDMVLYDIKAVDEEMHKRCTGVSNIQILKNAQLASAMKIPMIIRLVVVPGYNDDLEDLKKRIDFADSLGSAVQQTDILKYHIYGIGKYEKLDIEYPIKGDLEIDDAKIENLINYARKKGLKVTIGG